MPGPHDFAVRSNLSQSFQRTMCCPPSFGEGVEAPFVFAPVDRSQSKPALRSPFARRRCRVHRIPPRVRDDRDTPLCGEDARVLEMIWGKWKEEYFPRRGLTGGIKARSRRLVSTHRGMMGSLPYSHDRQRQWNEAPQWRLIRRYG
jgi:hypothetical protein